MTHHSPDPSDGPKGRFVVEDGVEWYRIENADLLDPFLVTLVTPTDQWMFVSSSGALTAGRRSAERALFPYETDDRLHRAAGRIGPVTAIWVGDELWEPFAPHVPFGRVERTILKTSEGDRVRFEERHLGLGLTFRATWASSDRFGFVRSCEVHSDVDDVGIEILDGLTDVLPSGVDPWAHARTSTLIDGYQRAEIDPVSGAAVFTLEALVVDKPEPAESLRANTVWSHGLAEATVLLSDRQVRRFRSGESIDTEQVVKGTKTGFFVSASTQVSSLDPVRWIVVGEVDQSASDLETLRAWLAASDDPAGDVFADVAAARRDLVAIVRDADALQESADHRSVVHHFANVLFNVMRGGVFLDDHRVVVADVARFIADRNAAVADRCGGITEALDPVVEIGELRASVAGDDDLARLVAEYLPLVFSRRHGDPSRPWNMFEIKGKTDSGWQPRYEGNWRDIFQNWEALLHSYPEFTESVIAKFLSASTVDGFNPYRITDLGIDWEMPEEGGWANLGYWGDHQIVYLHRLLDVSRRFYPGELERHLGRVWLSYADVPYRLLPYEEIAANPKATIDFDHNRQAEIDQRVAAIGADGRLVPGSDGSSVHLASFAEKLLVPALSKLSNLVAGAGIWMNTQRPEWNDANNALVGNGVSAVTLIYLRDYLALLDDLFSSSGDDVEVGQHVVGWLEGVRSAFEASAAMLESDVIAPQPRRRLLDALGTAFSDYRALAYEAGPGDPVRVSRASIQQFIRSVLPLVEQAVRLAQRDDGLYESYCLLKLTPGEAHVESLYEMLEGQVAALAAAGLDSEDAVRLVDRMFEGPLYRPDQDTFMLYPYRDLPAFWEKNVVPEGALGPTAEMLLADGAGILVRDAAGWVRFDASFSSAAPLRAALDGVRIEGVGLDPSQRQELIDLYEHVFNHAAFTGRSGTMYQYEGLGSVYWHMVSKLVLALQEHVARAVDHDAADREVAHLRNAYLRLRAGLPDRKNVDMQGTFPTDPHSHTPRTGGAQQPGMTGQVKEGVLLRWGELGLRVADGRLRFRPTVLSRMEFLTYPLDWPPLGDGPRLEAGMLGFTYCGVPIVYHAIDGDAWSQVHWDDGTETQGGPVLDAESSTALFERRGRIQRIDVGIPESWLI